MKAYSAAAVGLRDHGVTTMFGVMGDANMHLVDSFVHAASGRYVAAANEGGAVLMAAGFAAVTGDVGAATMTHGAITNAVSALFDAARGGYPIVVVLGDTGVGEDYSLQNLPHSEIVAPTGARFLNVRSAAALAGDISRAVRWAITERRPVVVNLPTDVQRQEVDYDIVRWGALPSPVWSPDPAAVEDAVGVISAARRPIVIGGRGAIGEATRDAVAHCAEQIGAPVATTLRAKDLFRGDPFNLGICGSLSVPVATEVIAKSDCIVSFGATLSALTGDGGDLFAGKRIVQCDRDPGALSRYFPADVAVVADAGEAARAIGELWQQAELRPAGYRSDALRAQLAAYSHAEFRRRNPPGTVDLRDALIRIDEVVADDRNLVVDAGRFLHEALRIVRVADPRAYVHCLNVSQIGMSIGYGIGAATGAPDRPTLVVAGDGGFMLGGITEFNTAVRHSLDLVVFVLNDSAYGAEYYRLVAEGMDASLTAFEWPGFAGIATALGGVGLTVRTESDFDAVRSALATRRGPVLVDVKLDPDTVPEPGRH